MINILRSILLSLILCFTLINISFAAGIGGKAAIDPDKSDTKTDEENYIDNFSDKIILRPYLIIPIQFLEIQHYEKNKLSKVIKYEPNYALCGGIGVSYWVFGLSFHIALVNTQKSTNLYGKTNFIDFQFNYYFRKFGFDLFYQKYKGFYLDKPTRYGYIKGTPLTKRSDLSIRTIGFNLFYVFSDNYSLDASFKQTERQNKSKGSFLVMLSTINYKIHSNYSLIPTTQELFYGWDRGFKKGDFTSIGISPGYAYTFTLWKYFITPAIFLGSGIMKKSYIALYKKRYKIGSFIKGNFKLGFGYNADKFFYGFSIILDMTNSRASLGGRGISVSTFGGFVETYGGYRF